MSASVDVGVDVLTLNSVKLSVLVIVASTLSLFVDTTFDSGISISTFRSTVPETLLLAVTV